MNVRLLNGKVGIVLWAVAAIFVAACSENTPMGLDEAPLYAVGAESAQPADVLEDFGGGTGATIHEAALIRGANTVTTQLVTTVDAPNTATLWAVVFNAPENCFTTPCAMADLVGNPAAAAGMLNAGGRVFGGANTTVAASLRENDTKGLSRGVPLQDAQRAEVHFIVRLHGEPIAGETDDQIHTLMGGCATNGCVNAAAAIFLAPGS